MGGDEDQAEMGAKTEDERRTRHCGNTAGSGMLFLDLGNRGMGLWGGGTYTFYKQRLGLPLLNQNLSLVQFSKPPVYIAASQTTNNVTIQ